MSAVSEHEYSTLCMRPCTRVCLWVEACQLLLRLYNCSTDCARYSTHCSRLGAERASAQRALEQAEAEADEVEVLGERHLLVQAAHRRRHLVGRSPNAFGRLVGHLVGDSRQALVAIERKPCG